MTKRYGSARILALAAALLGGCFQHHTADEDALDLPYALDDDAHAEVAAPADAGAPAAPPAPVAPAASRCSQTDPLAALLCQLGVAAPASTQRSCTQTDPVAALLCQFGGTLGGGAVGGVGGTVGGVGGLGDLLGGLLTPPAGRRDAGVSSMPDAGVRIPQLPQVTEADCVKPVNEVVQVLCELRRRADAGAAQADAGTAADAGPALPH